MTHFIKRGAAPVAALVVSLTALSPLLAQDVPDTTRIERFGVGMAYPADMRIEEDRHSGDRLEFSVIRQHEDGISLRMGLRVVTPAVWATLPAQPGDEGFAAFLSQVAQVTLERTEIAMRIGGAAFRVYSGTGARVAADGTEEHERALFLVTEEPMESGDGLWIAVYSTGLTPEMAQQVEADFVSDLTLDAAVAGVRAPLVLLDGLVRLTPPEGRSLSAWREARRGMVEIAAAGAEAPDTLLSAELLPDAGDAVGALAGNRLSRIDAVREGMRDGMPVWILEGEGHPPGDEGQVGGGAGPTRLELSTQCPPGEGPVVIGATATGGPVDPALLDAMAFDLPEDATDCAAPLAESVAALRDGGPEAVDPPPAETAEAPEGEGDPGQDPAAPEIAPEIAGEAGTPQGGPDLAQPDPGDGAPPAGPLAADILPLPEPDGTVPEGWVSHRRFGVDIAAPAEAAISSDHATPARMEFLAEIEDRAAQTTISAGVMIASPETLAQMPPPGSDAFVAMMAGWAGMPVERLDATLTLGGHALRVYSALGVGEDDQDLPLGRLVYLVPDTPLPNGNTPFVAAAAVGFDDAGARAVIHDILRSLAVETPQDWGRIDDPAAVPEGQADAPDPAIPADWQPIEAFGLRLFVPPGLTVENRRVQDGRAELFLSGLDRDAMSGVEIGLRVLNAEGLAEATQGDPTDLAATFSQSVGIAIERTDRIVTLADGSELAWFEGAGVSDREGEVWIVFLASESADANGLYTWVGIANFGRGADEAEAVTRAVAAGLGGAADVPEIVLDPAAGAAAPGESLAEVLPPQPPSGVIVTPGAGGSKDPTAPGTDPEAGAWASAEAAQSAEAMIAYLLAWPEGAHAAAARDWLMARAIVPPGAPAPSAQPPQVEMPAMNPEQEAWQRVLTQGTPAALWTYLKGFPDGANAAQARAMLAGDAPLPQSPLSPPVPEPESVPAPLSDK